MKKNENLMRRLVAAISKIDRLYYIWGKNTKIKENLLILMYALNDDEIHTQKQLCDLFLIPKTTLNTIVKECVRKKLVILETIDNKKEKNIILTEKGKKYADEITQELTEIEQIALKKTLEKYPIEFIDAYEYLEQCMEEELDKRLNKE